MRADEPMAASLRNRLLIATTLWRDAVRDPAAQIEAFELQLIDRLCQGATPETAGEVADRTWDLVHDRPDDDPVKQRVVECHEELARLERRVP